MGVRLKRLRIKRKLTIEELANELDLSKYLFLYWEMGEITFTIKQLIKVAKYFNVTTDYLLGL